MRTHRWSPAIAVAFLALFRGWALAGGPMPQHSEVDPRIVTCPAGDSLFRVIARETSSEPRVNGITVVDFCGCPEVRFAASIPDSYVVDGCRVWRVTDPRGRTDFHLRAGGVCAGGVISITCDGYPLATRRWVASTDQDGNLFVDQDDVDLVTSKVGSADSTADLDGDGAITQADVVIVQAHLGHSPSGTVDVAPRVHGAFRVHPASPNPSRGRTRLAFDLTRAGPTSLEAFDSSGRRVRVLLDRRELPAGRHEWDWDGRDGSGFLLPPGVYYVRLRAGTELGTIRVALVR